jgi:hypothetical protein
VPGDGYDDNVSFTISGDLLLASESLDYEKKNQYQLRIRSNDEAGIYCEVSFNIIIIDVDETTGLPVISTKQVRSHPNAYYLSTTIQFQNRYNEPSTLVLTDLSGKVCRIVDDVTTSYYVLYRLDL